MALDLIQITPGVGVGVATDREVVTDKHRQLFKLEYGGIDTFTMVSDANRLPVRSASKSSSVAGSAGALNELAVPTTDVSDYSFASVQILGTWVGILSFEGSNDNINWNSITLYAVSSTTGGGGTTTTANTFASGPIGTKFFRVRMSAYTSGTATGTAFLSSEGSIPAGYAVNTELPSPATLADNASTPSAPAVGSFGMMYDGTTWDMLRGDSTNGLKVQVSTIPIVTVQDGGGSLTVDGAVALSGTSAVSGIVTANESTGAGKTLKFATISTATLGDNTLVAAVAANKIKVVSYTLVAASGVGVKFTSGAAGPNLTGAMTMSTGIAIQLANPASSHLLETGVNAALVLNLSAAAQVSGHLSYFEEA